VYVRQGASLFGRELIKSLTAPIAVAHQLTRGIFAMNCSVRRASVFSQSIWIRVAVRNRSTSAGGITDQSMASAPQSGRRPS
jgi:hypothetical protein